MADLVARASVLIGASRQITWDTLLLPDTLTKIMPVAVVIAPWRAGERFAWAFEMLGKRTLVEGRVLRLEEGVLLAYEYADPHSRDVLHQDKLHQVAIVLSDEDQGTRVSVTQDANVSRAAQLHAEGGWRLALNQLKGLLERR